MGKRPTRRIFISYQHKDRNRAKGFNLLRWNPNVPVDFVGRHLLDPVDSTNKDYIDRRIREELTNTSVTVVLIGRDTPKSEYQPKEIAWSLEKSSQNGILGIKLKGVPDLPPGSEVAKMLSDAGAEIMPWKPEKFSDAIERAAKAAGRAAAVRRQTPGSGRCFRK